MQNAFVAALALIALSAPAAAEEPAGYGSWRLGMTRDEVMAVTSHGPYSPVAATGGLETPNAQFQGRKITASFVFGAQGLRHIQLWAYEGRELARALEALHSVYLYLADRCGPLHSDGRPIGAGLSAADLERLLPPELKTGTDQSQLGELSQRGSIRARFHDFHLHPQTTSPGANVYGTLSHSPQLGLYWVFVFIKSPEVPAKPPGAAPNQGSGQP